MAQWVWVQISSAHIKKKYAEQATVIWASELEQTTAETSRKTSSLKNCPVPNKTYFCYIIFNCHPQLKSRHTAFKSWPTIERKPKNFNQHFVTAKKKNPNNPGLDPALWWIVDGKFRFAQWGALWCSEAGFKRASADLMSRLWSKTLPIISASVKSGEIYFIWKQCRQTYSYFKFQCIIECVTKILVQAKRRHKTKPSKILKYRMVE